MNGLIALADTVATEQQARTNLVDRRDEDRGGERITCPAVVTVDAASQPNDPERRPVFGSKRAKPLRDGLQHRRGTRVMQRAPDSTDDSSRVIRCLVHDQPTVDHEADSPRRRALMGRPVRLQRQIEHRQIEHPGLAATRRHADALMPAFRTENFFGKSFLPPEWPPPFSARTVDSLEEIGKLRGSQVTHRSTPLAS